MSRPRFLADNDLDQHIIAGVLRRQRQPIAPVIESLVLIWSASEAGEWHDRITFLPLKLSGRRSRRDVADVRRPPRRHPPLHADERMRIAFFKAFIDS